MSLTLEHVHVCDRCGNAFEHALVAGGFERPRTMSVDARIYTGGSGSWPSDNTKGYCTSCTEVIEEVLKPIEVDVDERVYPEDIIKDRRRARELYQREEAKRAADRLYGGSRSF